MPPLLATTVPKPTPQPATSGQCCSQDFVDARYLNPPVEEATHTSLEFATAIDATVPPGPDTIPKTPLTSCRMTPELVTSQRSPSDRVRRIT